MKSIVLAALTASCFSATAAQVGEWTYLLTPGNIGRTASMVGNRNGHIYGQAELFKEEGDSYFFRLRGVTADECLNVKVAAVVDDSETGQLVITPAKRFPSCPSIRLVIKTNGSGGVVQQLVGKKSSQTWLTDEDHDYGLTPR
ncbi:hypothetical protein [Variovorax sp. ZT4R33]|uniref:hypothetical protein n=1 Tax=Variovorax sp. ZT4R33 TaxID=3443743 RepID=UPI003F47D416